MDLPHLKGTGLRLHRATDHHHHRDILRQTGILRQMDIRHKATQAIHLLREDLHHSLAMEGMARHRRSSHQGRTVGDISRHHRQRARVMGRLYLEDHNTQDDQVSPPHTRTHSP